jgi:hypothetical protein
MGASDGQGATSATQAAAGDSRETAFDLLKRGFWPVAIYPLGVKKPDGRTSTGKDPIGAGWGLTKITRQEIDIRFGRYHDVRVGIALGPEKGPDGKWLVDIEGDGKGAEETILRWFGGVVTTMSWSSRRGIHRAFTVDGQVFLELLSACKAVEEKGPGKVGTYHLNYLPNLEIRCGGRKRNGQVKQVQSLIPPSVTDGLQRVWIHGPERLVELPQSAYDYLRKRAKRLATKPSTELAAAGNAEAWDVPVTTPTSTQAAWFRAALEGEANEVASALEGSRRNRLRDASYTLGGRLHYGYLDEKAIVQALTSAASKAGLPPDEIAKTISDGIADGKASPLGWPDKLARPKGSAPSTPSSNARARQSARTPANKSKKNRHKKAAARTASQAPDVQYVERNGCTYVVSIDRRGVAVDELLAGFTARIVREIKRHEAGEITRQFEIKATHATGTVATATIKAGDFESMAWVPAELGSRFSIEPGRGTRDLMRHALQLLSHREHVEHLEVFTALGWHEIGGELVYLHAGGGIGAAGPVAVQVETAKELAIYRLPAPDKTRFAQAVESVLMLHGLLGDKAVASIAASLPYRAVLGPTRFVPHFSGSTGTRKTSIACLIARFFAPGLRRTDTMPATWSSTANGLQRAQHDAGDLLLVIDNLIADGDQAARELFKADMVFNTQGDLGGRRRMRTDGTLAPALDPRGCLLSTGEVDPQRRSALGRSLIVEFVPGKFSDAILDQCHAAAEAGDYAQTIASYVQHLAAPGRLNIQRQALRQLATQEQAAASKQCGECHPRQAEAVGELVASWRLFLDFAADQGAITNGRADNYVDEVRDSLFGLLAAQASIQHESDAGELFLDLVRSLLASKRAVLFSINGDMPPIDIAGACGWEHVTISTRAGSASDWQPAPGAARIGWVDALHVYLDPANAHAAAERLARETRQVLGSQRQILARLAETARILLDLSKPGERRRFTRKVTAENSRRAAVWMLRDEVLALQTSTKSPRF